MYRCHAGPGRYDWSFPDQTYPALRKLGIAPITDLCHFGVPTWAGDFQNPDYPPLFAEYAAAFARRYPWVRLYTPVNEIFIAANFSAQNGWWNERLTSDAAFVTAIKHLSQATLLAEEAILREQPNAIFIKSESSQYFHDAGPETQKQADFYNQKRFIPLDLCYGHDVGATTYEYLLDHGMTRDEYHWFGEHGAAITPYCVMGNDYYSTNEYKVTSPDGAVEGSGEIFGYYVITHQYFQRYHLPVMHTETNRKDAADAPAWLAKEWANVVRLKQDGVPILGFTWYSLIDQTDWDTALREDNHRINPCGLFDHHRKIHPVGKAYKQLIEQWRNRLPMESLYRELGSEELAAPSDRSTAGQAGTEPSRHGKAEPAGRESQKSRPSEKSPRSHARPKR